MFNIKINNIKTIHNNIILIKNVLIIFQKQESSLLKRKISMFVQNVQLSLLGKDNKQQKLMIPSNRLKNNCRNSLKDY